jgi:RNA polymerase sigma factor (sigma-70 family)
MISPTEHNSYVDELVKACLHSQRKAQLKLYELFSKTMYNTSLRIVQDSMLAEDIVQEAFLKAFISIEQFRKEVPFGIWLKRIVINKSIDELRKRKIELLQIEENLTIAETTEDDDLREINEKRIAALKLAISKLSDGYRIVFNLFYFEGFDHQEIASILNITESTSRSQLARARQKVIEQMKAHSV